jgi:hypothetical protein
MADHSEHIHDTLADDKIGGAIKASPGRPPAEFYSNMNIPAKFSMGGNYYHERSLQLEGQLTDANRKIQQITDELFQARKDLSQDKTELLLAHQNEIARLKEEFRDKLDGLKEANTSKVHELEKEIEKLDREQFKKDLEYQNAQQSPGNQFVEQFVKKTPEVIDTLGGLISIIVGQRHGLGPIATYTPPSETINTAPENVATSSGEPTEHFPETSRPSQPEPLLEEAQPKEQTQANNPTTPNQ